MIKEEREKEEKKPRKEGKRDASLSTTREKSQK